MTHLPPSRDRSAVAVASTSQPVATRVHAKGGAEGPHDALRADPYLLERTRRVDDEVRHRGLLCHGHLRRQPCVRLAFVDAVPPHEPSDLGSGIDRDDDERTKVLHEAVFDEQGGFVGGERVAVSSEVASEGQGALPDERMRDLLERSSRRGILEDQGRHGLAIQRARMVEHTSPESSGNAHETVGTRRDHLASHHVRVDHGQAAFLQDAGDGALAAGDAAGQPEEREGHAVGISPGESRDTLATRRGCGKHKPMSKSLVRARGTVLAVVLSVVSTACGAEMIRPRAAGERFEDRPGRALVVGQFDLAFEGFDEDPAIGITRHRVLVGDEEVLFTDEIPPGGRTFALWVYPGVFCFARPTLGEGDKPKTLGKGAPCAEIPEKETAYYVGSVTWRIKKKGDKVSATLEVDNEKESVMASRNLAGIYPETALVTEKFDAEKVAAKYALP